MRTTVTFDRDVAVLLRKEMARQHAGLKQVLNDLLRRSFAEEHRPRRKHYRVRALSTGPARMSIDNVAEALELAEGTSWR